MFGLFIIGLVLVCLGIAMVMYVPALILVAVIAMVLWFALHLLLPAQVLGLVIVAPSYALVLGCMLLVWVYQKAKE